MNDAPEGTKRCDISGLSAYEHYSKRVSMERIVEEGYNLNISRYISTATAEAEIDLAETHKLLVQVEKTISSAREKHNQFLKELGLPPLPGT